MANPYRKLSAGSPVTAFSITAYNRMIDMLAWWDSQQSSGGGPIRGLVDWDQAVFRVRNDTNGDLLSYSVVGLDGPIFDPNSGGEPELLSQTSQKGVEPTVADHLGKWGVMLEAAADGKIGRCCLAGVVPVRVYVTATSDTHCDVIAAETVGDDTTYIGTGPAGCQLLWLDPDADAETIAWAIVRLGASTPGVRFYIGTTTGAVTAGTDFHVSSLTATDGGSVPDPDHTSPDTWNVANSVAGGDGHVIDTGKVGKIIGYADGTLHPLDFPCSTA